jgi:hypothetical protein
VLSLCYHIPLVNSTQRDIHLLPHWRALVLLIAYVGANVPGACALDRIAAACAAFAAALRNSMAARRANVPAAVSAAAVVADSVIESVTSAARIEGVSVEVLQKLSAGWRGRYNELYQQQLQQRVL